MATINLQQGKKFAFNPITLKMSGLGGNVKTMLLYLTDDISYIMVTRKVVFGEVTFDISAAVQSMFDRQGMQPKLHSNTFKKIWWETYENGIGDFTSNGDFDILWGGLQIGEKYSQFRKLTFFTEFPFTVPVLFDTPGTLSVSKDDAPFAEWQQINAGKHDVDVSQWKTSEKTVIIQNGTQPFSVWDETFDVTFRGDLSPIPVTIKIELEVNKCTEGIYLRWVNKYGDFCYWLFDQNTETNNVSDINVSIEQYFTTTDFVNGFHGGTNHPKGKEAQRTIALFAPLVNSDNFDFLNTLIDSSIVDLYKGYNNWVRVNIAPANIVKSDDDLQDFVCTLILPKTFTQEF